MMSTMPPTQPATLADAEAEESACEQRCAKLDAETTTLRGHVERARAALALLEDDAWGRGAVAVESDLWSATTATASMVATLQARLAAATDETEQAQDAWRAARRALERFPAAA
jgi:multidrug resistance efflux pump